MELESFLQFSFELLADNDAINTEDLAGLEMLFIICMKFTSRRGYFSMRTYDNFVRYITLITVGGEFSLDFVTTDVYEQGELRKFMRSLKFTK